MAREPTRTRRRAEPEEPGQGNAEAEPKARSQRKPAAGDDQRLPNLSLRVVRPERLAGVMRALSAVFLVAMLAATPAEAAHCPHGQFYRVRLNKCVGLNSRLAWAYVRVAAASRLVAPRGAERTAPRVEPEPEAKPVGEPETVIPFVLPLLNDWPTPK